MFSYYILPTGYLIVLFAFSLLKPIRFVVTMYEFQGIMIKSVVLAIFGLFSQHSILTQFYGIWFNVTLIFSISRVFIKTQGLP